MLFSSFTSMLEVLGKFNKMSENLTNWGKLNLNCNFKIVIPLLDILVQRKGRVIQQMPRCLTTCVLCWILLCHLNSCGTHTEKIATLVLY